MQSSPQTAFIEARIAMHIAIHANMATSTCLIKCLKSCLRHEDAAHLARTKCTAVVKNGLMPMYKKRLMNAIGSRPFSLFLDEATDKAGHNTYFG